MNKTVLALGALASLGLAAHAIAQDTKAAAPAPAAAAPAAAPIPDALKDPRALYGYAVGLNIGSRMKQDKLDVDPQAFAHGVADALTGATPLLTQDQVKSTLEQLQASMQARAQAEAAKAATENKAQGEAFLKDNATKPGVVVLPSGLQYQIIKAGTGPLPKLTDTVVCNYRGTLVDGAEFDSSASHGGPATFPVQGVIKGWTEALQKMPVGSKWRLFVPSDLAYGEHGAGPTIGPNATLIFDVELVSIAPIGK